MGRESVEWNSLSERKIKFGSHHLSSFVTFKCPMMPGVKVAKGANEIDCL